jgi:hypothetical protein
MKIKTKDLTGAALDWAVAKCENSDTSIEHFIAMHSHYAYDHGTFDYSTNWAQGGPIIEREGITLRCGLHGWDAELEEFDAISHGPTALIAAMRCYVASKLGDEVDIPEGLL